MAKVHLRNLTHPLSSPLEVDFCSSFISRLMGLMFRPAIELDGGILMVQSSESRVNAAIHMFFMNFDIAVIWLDNHLQVVDAKIAFRRQAVVTPVSPARYILEIHSNRLLEFSIGDQIELTSP